AVGAASCTPPSPSGSPRRIIIRHALLLFHRWLGLVASAAVIVVALSGSVVALEAVYQGPQRRVRPGPARLPLDTLAARAGAAPGTVLMMFPPSTPDQPFAVIFTGKAGREQVEVNPYSGAVLPRSPRPSTLATLLRTLHRIHTSLLAARVGSAVVAVVAIASLV